MSNQLLIQTVSCYRCSALCDGSSSSAVFHSTVEQPTNCLSTCCKSSVFCGLLAYNIRPTIIMVDGDVRVDP